MTINDKLVEAKLKLMNDPEFKDLTFGEAGEIMKEFSDKEKLELISACYMLGYYSAKVGE